VEKKTRKFLLISSAIGAVHFAVSLSLWGMSFFIACKISQDATRNSSQNWNEFLNAIPAVVLFLLFIMAFIFGFRGLKSSACVLVLAVLLAVASFTYDVSTRNYQMHVESLTGDNQGGTFKYFTWWWYSHY
jgi:ABC-type proline/glycine betaine transport system permease subunit